MVADKINYMRFLTHFRRCVCLCVCGGGGVGEHGVLLPTFPAPGYLGTLTNDPVAAAC